MNNRPSNEVTLQPGRPVVIWGSGVCDRWFKGMWQGQRGVTNPIVAFMDDTPISYFRGGVDGLPVVAPQVLLQKYSECGSPFVMVGRSPKSDAMMSELARAGLKPGIDAAFYPEAPDYTIDWLAFYPTLAAAQADTKGYEDPVSIEEHIQRGREERAKPRDADLSYADQRLFTPFARIFSTPQESLTVLDFGGALGAHYLRFKNFFPGPKLRWIVCETAAMAQAGKTHFQNPELSFISDPAEAAGPIDLIIASSSLHYVENSEESYDRLCALRARYFLIDRTPLTPWPDDRLLVQRVFRNTPARRFETSYFVRFLSDARWTARFQRDHTIAMRWPDTHDIVDAGGERIVYSGLLLEQK